MAKQLRYGKETQEDEWVSNQDFREKYTLLSIDDYLKQQHQSDKDKSWYLYMISAGITGPVKIGHSVDVRKRLVTLQTASHERLFIQAVTLERGQLTEAKLHKTFKPLRIRGEWFKNTPELSKIAAKIRDAERYLGYDINPLVAYLTFLEKKLAKEYGERKT